MAKLEIEAETWNQLDASHKELKTAIDQAITRCDKLHERLTIIDTSNTAVNLSSEMALIFQIARELKAASANAAVSAGAKA